MKWLKLEPLADRILRFMERTGGITAQEAYLHLDGTTSATLSRRIVDIRNAGYEVRTERRRNPITGKLYTRYLLAREAKAA